MMYTTKPKLVEGYPATELLHQAAYDWFNLPYWVVQMYDAGDLLLLSAAVRVKTPEGWRDAEKGDWIVRTEGGSVWPVPGHVFQSEYEVLA